ncbi:MAG: hypothetical protein JWO06_3673 [Bacteroidota bacterium]|nr:hypothetical protein [Bacteroidota bacterium]
MIPFASGNPAPIPKTIDQKVKSQSGTIISYISLK